MGRRPKEVFLWQSRRISQSGRSGTKFQERGLHRSASHSWMMTLKLQLRNRSGRLRHWSERSFRFRFAQGRTSAPESRGCGSKHHEMSDPSHRGWGEVLGYLHGTSSLGLVYQKCDGNRGLEEELSFADGLTVLRCSRTSASLRREVWLPVLSAILSLPSRRLCAQAWVSL